MCNTVKPTLETLCSGASVGVSDEEDEKPRVWESGITSAVVPGQKRENC